MSDGHSIGASTENSALSRVLSSAAGSWDGYRAWRHLDPECRLQLIEKALRTTDGLVDDFSLAL